MSSPSFSKYLTEIGAIPLLTPEREAELGRIVQIGLRSNATEAQKTASGEAQRELIHKNLKLVVSIANRFLGSTLTLEELTSDGNRGLITASKRFNPVFKTRFSTYATWWIQQAIREGLQRVHTIRIPVRRVKLLREILGSQNFVEDASDQNLEGIEKDTGISKDKIAQILSSRCTIVSFNAPRHDSDEGIETVFDGGWENPAQVAMKAEEARLVSAAVSELSPQEMHIICARFGIESGESKSLESLAAVYGVSRERIRQIEKTALRRMRSKLKHLFGLTSLQWLASVATTPRATARKTTSYKVHAKEFA